MMAFIFGAFISLMLLMGIAMPAEKTLIELEKLDIGTGTVYDLPGGWSGSYNDAVFWMNLLYIVSVAPVVLGLIIWILSAIKTQDYDVLGDEDAPIPTAITPEEMQFYQQQGRV